MSLLSGRLWKLQNLCTNTTVLFVKSYKLSCTTRVDGHHCEEIRETKQQTQVVEKAKVDRYSYRNFLNIVY